MTITTMATTTAMATQVLRFMLVIRPRCPQGLTFSVSSASIGQALARRETGRLVPRHLPKIVRATGALRLDLSRSLSPGRPLDFKLT